MTAHVDGLLDHAADIQHAAELEGELQQALETVTAGKQALEQGLTEERARVQQAPANVTPLLRASAF
jgi:hypothetical protein